ncbi:MAG: hypothetical protein LBE79_02335 [Tannerella sp.]|nr:hypothetical protein [Tannerella sp.]
MKNRIFLIAIAAMLMYPAASYGGRANNQTAVSSNDCRDAARSLSEAKMSHVSATSQPKQETMDNAAFAKLVQEIYLKLPKEVLPAFDYETPQMQQPTGAENDDFNCRRPSNAWDTEDFYAFWSWDMAAYLAEDNQNAVVIIFYRDGTTGEGVEQTEYTFNYHIPSGAFTEIERDEDEVSLIDELGVKNENTERIVRDFFFDMRYADYNSYSFDKNGYTRYVNLLSYWLKTKEADDEYDLEKDMKQELIAIHYKWNGKRFVKQ